MPYRIRTKEEILENGGVLCDCGCGTLISSKLPPEDEPASQPVCNVPPELLCVFLGVTISDEEYAEILKASEGKEYGGVPFKHPEVDSCWFVTPNMFQKIS